MKKIEENIKLKCLDIQVSNINSKLQTLSWLDYKVWIFLGFFFLVFFENIKFLDNPNLCFLKVSSIIFSILSLYFLFEAIFLKKINKLYINIDNTISYTWEYKIDWFIKHRFRDYKTIDLEIDKLINDREKSFKIWVIMFMFSLTPTIIYFLIK